MQTPTATARNRRRWAQLVGGGATALVAPPPSHRPRRCRTATPPTGAIGERRGAEWLEHGGAERKHWTDHGRLDGDHRVLQDRHRSGQRGRRRRLRLCDRDGVEEVQDHHRGAQHHGDDADVERDVQCVWRPRAPAAAGGAPGGPGGFRFRRGAAGGASSGEGGGTQTRPSFPGGGSGAGNFRKQLATLYRDRQGHGGERVHVECLGDTLALGNFPRTDQRLRSQDQEAHDAQNGEAHRDHVEHDDGQCDPVCRIHRPCRR